MISDGYLTVLSKPDPDGAITTALDDRIVCSLARELLAARRMIAAKDAVLDILSESDTDDPRLESALEAHEEAKEAWHASRS